MDANRGDVEAVFRNDNNPHLRIHDTVCSTATDIQAKLANHEVVFIPGMKVGGKTISTDLRYSDGPALFGNNARITVRVWARRTRVRASASAGVFRRFPAHNQKA